MCVRHIKESITMSEESPEQQDELVLDALKAAGHDLSQEMQIEFEIHTDSEQSAEAIADAASNQDFGAHVYAAQSEEDETSEIWVCICSHQILPQADAIRNARKTLTNLSQPHNGIVESWGTFGNAGPPRG